MKKYNIKFFYLATGMDGQAAEIDYGIIEADSPKEAMDKIVLQKYPEDIMYGPDNKWSVREFFRGCLNYKEIND